MLTGRDGELKLPFVTPGEFIIPTPPPEGIAAFSLSNNVL